MRNWSLALALSGLIFLSDTAEAVKVPDMTAASVPVADHSQQTFHHALPHLLYQVLVKVSGNPSVSTLPAIQNVLPNVERFIESYGYTTATDVSGTPQLMLRVVFDRHAISRLLKHAGQAVWGENRPLTLMWVSIPTDNQAIVLSDGNTTHPTALLIKHVVEQRGIPILFPTMDLEDQTNAALSSSRLLTSSQINAMADRYGVESVLAGSIIADNTGSYEGEWQLLLNGTPYEWQTTGTDISQVVTNGLERAADMMANQLATLENVNSQRMVVMKISGVEDLDDYVRMIAALRQLTPVTDITVSNMSGNDIWLKINTKGSLAGLTNALKTVPHFTKNNAFIPPDVGQNTADLFYRWGANPPHSSDEQ